MNIQTRRVANATMIIAGLFFPMTIVMDSFSKSPTFFWAWDAPRFFWHAWALAGIGLAATLSELFLPPKNQRLRAILALVFAIVAIALTYFIHQDAAATATQFEYNLRQQIDSSALLGMLAGGAANIGATLKQVPQASKINWYHVDIATYVWTFALIGYGIDALKRFLVEARTALNQAET